jgi:hypothetical protein
MKSSISGSRGPAGHFPESGLSQPMPRYSLQASIWASRLESEPAGFNRSHQASIWASRPESEAPGFNLSLEASISAPGFNLSLDASISAHSSQSEHFPPCGPPPNPYWNMTHSLYGICLYWTKASRPIFPNLGSLQIRVKIFADWFRFLIQLV